jgi:hypothetical protein
MSTKSKSKLLKFITENMEEDSFWRMRELNELGCGFEGMVYSDFLKHNEDCIKKCQILMHNCMKNCAEKFV